MELVTPIEVPDETKLEARALRIAFLHDWLFHMRGGEKCLRDLCELFPNSEIFTLFHDREAELDPLISKRKIHSSILNRIPYSRKLYKSLLLFFPLAISDLNKKLAKAHRAKPFDLVISVSHCAVKNIQAPSGLKHLCYCLTPARYLWDQYDRYVKRPWVRRLAAPVRSILRSWDVSHNDTVDSWIAISNFIANRIEVAYEKKAEVIYPAVKLGVLPEIRKRKGYFLVVNALVPYKNTDLTVEAFNKLGLPLVVVGAGPEASRLRSLARENISFRERVSNEELTRLYAEAEALVFAAEEDFGMTPVESLAAGTPVIAFGKGGALETVNCGQTGDFFLELTKESIMDAVKSFQKRKNLFSPDNCRANAEKFSYENFAQSVLRAVASSGLVCFTNKVAENRPELNELEVKGSAEQC